MKGSIKKAIYTGVAALFLFTSGGYFVDYSKKWVNNKVQSAIAQYEQQDKKWTTQNLEESVSQYETKDKQWTEQTFEKSIGQYDKNSKQWTDKSLKEGIGKYEEKDRQLTQQELEKGISQYDHKNKQWADQKFETKLPLEQIMKAYNSAYLILNEFEFKTLTGEPVIAPPATGSGIMLKGGYILTARHVTRPEVPDLVQHPLYGVVKKSSNKLFISIESPTTAKPGEQIKKWDIEEIIVGSEGEFDYALLKVKDGADLNFYPYGLNAPDKIEVGVSKTIIIGYPLGLGKNVRLGNISQIDSDYGKEYITYKNDICPSDSGGALFVVEDGDVKLTAVTTAGIVAQNGQMVNIGYGLKVSSIVKDMEEQLKSGKLDKNIVKEVGNFLKLNKN